VVKDHGFPLRGLLGPCILLLLSEAPSHGYQLIDPLRALGFDWRGPGPIYQELRKLERAQLISATWEQADGPARRVYELTQTGDAVLAISVHDMAAVAEVLDRLLARADRLASAAPEEFVVP
jgi:PadR family transcriptional regulator PadR